LQLLPGDMLFMTYEIEGLKLDPKTGKANYVTILELYEGPYVQGKKPILSEKTPNEGVIPQLGGNRMPGDLHVIMGPKQAPGGYTLKLTVHDKNDPNPQTAAKAFLYPFNVVKESFGMVAVTADAVGFLGRFYVPRFALINMTLDAKKQPDVEVAFKIYDQSRQQVSPTAYRLLPRDLPEGKDEKGQKLPPVDLEKANFVEVAYPVYLNKVGTYTMDITATDKLGKRVSRVTYTFTVVDPAGYTR
jgi:hypothetical protein